MTMGCVYSWQHQYAPEKMMSIEETSYQVYSQWQKLTTGQEAALALTADSMLSKLDKQDR